MKKTLIALLLCLICIPIYAYNSYGATATYEIQVSPKFQLNGNKIFSLSGAITGNWNLGYKKNLGIIWQLGFGSNFFQIKDHLIHKNLNINYEATLGLSYMSKIKGSNSLYTIFAIGGNVEKSNKTTEINNIDIGACIYAGIQCKINDTQFFFFFFKY